MERARDRGGSASRIIARVGVVAQLHSWLVAVSRQLLLPVLSTGVGAPTIFWRNWPGFPREGEGSYIKSARHAGNPQASRSAKPFAWSPLCLMPFHLPHEKTSRTSRVFCVRLIGGGLAKRVLPDRVEIVLKDSQVFSWPATDNPGFWVIFLRIFGNFLFF